MKDQQEPGRYLSKSLVSLLLEAPEDDEETTDREDKAAAQAWQEYLEKGGREWKQVRREL